MNNAVELYVGELDGLRTRYARAVNALRDIAALKPKPKTCGREIAIHALAMLHESREDDEQAFSTDE